jgi:hypothetical protein
MADPEVERHRQNKGSTQGDRMVQSLSFLYGSFSAGGLSRLPANNAIG